MTEHKADKIRLQYLKTCNELILAGSINRSEYAIIMLICDKVIEQGNDYNLILTRGMREYKSSMYLMQKVVAKIYDLKLFQITNNVQGMYRLQCILNNQTN